MITVHHLKTSRSDRIIWLLEELGLDYQLKSYERDPATRRAPAAYQALHELGRAPLIEDGHHTLMESGAIVEYLLHIHGNGRLAIAPGDVGYAQYLQWLHFAEGSLMFQLVLSMFLSGRIMPGLEPHALAPAIDAEVRKTLVFINAHLREHPYFAGDTFTAADIMMAWPLTMSQGSGQLEGLSGIQDYLFRITARPAYKRMRERAGY